MPLRHCIIHLIDKKPDGTPAVLYIRNAELTEAQVNEDLLQQFNLSYNAKTGKGWGFFHSESGAYPFSGWLKQYLEGETDFATFSQIAVEHLQKLMEESNLTTGGHMLFAHYQQGMTDYLVITLLQQTDSVTVTPELDVTPTRRLDLDQLHLAARVNLSEWQNNPQSKQYISFLKGKNGRRTTEYFREFIGCQEGIDAPGETRTLLKAFSDFVATEDLPEDDARGMSKTLVDFACAQMKIGEPVGLEALSELIDEDRPRAFYEHIRELDYGLSPEIPADKRTITQFRRLTSRTNGLSISFEARLLGSKVQFDAADATLTIRDVPSQLADQIKRANIQQPPATSDHNGQRLLW